MHALNKPSESCPKQEAIGCSLCPTRHVCTAVELEADTLPLMEACMSTSMPMAKGEHLYWEGDEAERCFVVRSGMYKSSTVRSDGSEYITGFYFPGELMGFDGQFSGHYLHSVVALETSTVCRLLIRDLPTLWSIGCGPSLLRMLAEQQAKAACRQINLYQSKADARLAGFLLETSRRMTGLKRDSSVIPTPMTRTDLANHLGITLECLSRVISRFTNAGLIHAQRSEIQLLKPADLKSLAMHAS